MRAFDAGFGPDDVTVRRRVRENEEASRIGAVGADDVIGVDDIFLRLRHLLDRADLGFLATGQEICPACSVGFFDPQINRSHPFALEAFADAIGLMHDHALGEETLEGLLEPYMTCLAHRAGKEARIEQMQDRVFDAADILVDRQPMARDRWIRRIVLPRGGETSEVPAGIDEGVHGVRLATGILAAAGAGHMSPRGMTVERVARLVEADVIGQTDWKILLRDRHDAAIIAVNDRDRATPVTLTGDAPVAQAEVDLAFALRRSIQLLRGQALGHLLKGFRRGHAIQEARIDHHAVIGKCGVADLKGRSVAILRHDDRDHRQVILAGEVEVALVAGGAAEDRARAVFHEHEIGDVDRQFPARIERVLHPDTGIDALLLGCFQSRERRAGMTAFLAEGINRFVTRCSFLRHRMIGGDRQERRTEQGIGTGRVNSDFARLAAGGHFPSHGHAFRAADPVLLHQPDLFRPLVELIKRVKQVLAEIGDLEEPLSQFALFDQRTRAPAPTVDDLLVSEHRHVLGVPVDLGILAIDETLFQEIQEEVLLAMVVVDVAGREFTRPVERQAHGLQLTTHGGNVLIGPGLGMNLVLHRRIFSRHTEGVPAHRMQNVVAAGTLVASHNVAHRVVADMAHMDASRRIGEHLEDVVFLARISVVRLEDLVFRPFCLPTGLGVARIVTFGSHGLHFRE